MFSPMNKKLLHTANISKKLGTSSDCLYKGLAPEELTNSSLSNTAKCLSKVSGSHVYFDNLRKKSLGRASTTSGKNCSQENLIQENSPMSKQPLPNSALEQSAFYSQVLFQTLSPFEKKNKEIQEAARSPPSIKKRSSTHFYLYFHFNIYTPGS